MEETAEEGEAEDAKNRTLESEAKAEAEKAEKEGDKEKEGKPKIMRSLKSLQLRKQTKEAG